MRHLRRTPIRSLVVLLVSCALAACGEEPAEREYTRPPEVRSPVAEHLLSESAKRSVAEEARKLEERNRRIEAAAADARDTLHEMPEDFPAAFTAFPGLEWVAGFHRPPITLVSFSAAESVQDALARVQTAASADGWVLEAAVETGKDTQASFQKEDRRVEVFLVPVPGAGTRVSAMLTQLGTAQQPAPAAP